MPWWAKPWVQRAALKMLGGLMIAAAPLVTSPRWRHVVEVVAEAVVNQDDTSSSSSSDGGTL